MCSDRAYTVATLVGVARTCNDAHFASDVQAGALIGTWVGHSVVAGNHTDRAKTMVLLPETGDNLIGLRLSGNF